MSARAMACWAASTAVVNASGDNIDTIDSRGITHAAPLSLLTRLFGPPASSRSGNWTDGRTRLAR